MDISTLTAFFIWCTVIDGAVLLLWTLIWLLAPDFVYRVQNRWFPLPRAFFDRLMYAFLGLFKIFFIVFNLVPMLALLIIG